MEYQLVIRNRFATFEIINQLSGRGDWFSRLKDPWIGNRPFVRGNFDPHLSPVLTARLNRTMHSHPVHETRDFSVFQLSNKGSLTKDYYHFPDNRILVYDRQLQLAFWEHILGVPYTNVAILDSPLGHAIINSPFAKLRGGKPHPGTDYLAAGGNPYHATAKGTVAKASHSATYGNVVIIDHGRGYNGGERVYTLYAHASKLLVHVGEPVNTGDIVSLTGNTGRVFPPPPRGFHGHYEVIQTNAVFGSLEFYAFKHKHPATDLRKLLTGISARQL